MAPRTLARLLALGRVGLGGALLVAPAAVGGPWIGDDAERPGARVLCAALGARDLGLGLGTLRALSAGSGAAVWLRAGILADGADLAATLLRRKALPASGVWAVAAMAGGAVLLGARLQAAVD